MDTTSDRILAAVDERALLLIHDQVLPSVTALIVGAPVEGSWWSHPMANTIFNALGAIESDVAVVKLISGKKGRPSRPSLPNRPKTTKRNWCRG